MSILAPTFNITGFKGMRRPAPMPFAAGSTQRSARFPWAVPTARLRDTAAGVSGSATSQEEASWDLGVTYAGSSWTAGLAMATAKRPLSSAVPGSDSVTKYVFGVSYDLTAGGEILGTLAHVDWQDESTADSNNNSGFALVAGISVTF
jgi:hypothetical protein